MTGSVVVGSGPVLLIALVLKDVVTESVSRLFPSMEIPDPEPGYSAVVSSLQQ